MDEVVFCTPTKIIIALGNTMPNLNAVQTDIRLLI